MSEFGEFWPDENRPAFEPPRGGVFAKMCANQIIEALERAKIERAEGNISGAAHFEAEARRFSNTYDYLTSGAA